MYKFSIHLAVPIGKASASGRLRPLLVKPFQRFSKLIGMLFAGNSSEKPCRYRRSIMTPRFEAQRSSELHPSTTTMSKSVVSKRGFLKGRNPKQEEKGDEKMRNNYLIPSVCVRDGAGDGAGDDTLLPVGIV